MSRNLTQSPGRKVTEGPGGLELVEEAYHLLRSCSPSDFLAYHTGAVPFVMMAYFFWADMGVAATARQDLPVLSLLTALSYFWMKIWQAVFCRRLWRRLSPDRVIPGWRALAAQVLIHSFTFPALILGLAFVVPFGWCYAFFHNVAVLGLTRDYGRTPLRGLIAAASRHTHHAWGQNHVVMLVLLVFSQLVWLNVVIAAAMVPLMLSLLFGFSSVFTENTSSALFNSTFLLGTLLVAWLITSPLVKAVYVLRCFRAEAATTGDDLLSRLGEANRLGAPHRGLRLAALLLACGMLGSAVVSAQEAPSGGTDRAAALGEAIGATLESRVYEWRLPGQGDPVAEEHGLLASLEKWVDEKIDWIQNWWKRITDRDDSPLAQANPGEKGSWNGQGIAIGLLLVVAFFLAWLAVIVLKRHRLEAAEDFTPDPGAGNVDLESEEIMASQLPENEWARLARERFQAGDFRLAVRAWFLATLSHLGDRGLVTVARWKSNRDYQIELGLRVRGRALPIDAFTGNVAFFERVWYGRHAVTGTDVENFRRNHERLTDPDETS